MKTTTTSSSTPIRSLARELRRALHIQHSLLVFALTFPALVLAGPEGGTVVHGDITITRPNADFISGGMMDLNTGAQPQGSRFIQLKADTINISGTTTAPHLLIRILPITPGLFTGLEAVTIGSQGTNITALSHFAPSTGTTIVLGQNSPVDVGDKNVPLLTDGEVTGNIGLTGTRVISVATAENLPEDKFEPVTVTKIATAEVQSGLDVG